MAAQNAPHKMSRYTEWRHGRTTPNSGNVKVPRNVDGSVHKSTRGSLILWTTAEQKHTNCQKPKHSGNIEQAQHCEDPFFCGYIPYPKHLQHESVFFNANYVCVGKNQTHRHTARDVLGKCQTTIQQGITERD